MANGNSPLIIKNFQKGIAHSSYLGFEEIRGLNITDKPGVCFPNYSLTKESSTTIDQKIIDTCWDNQGQLWAVGATKLFKRTTAGIWSSITLTGTPGAIVGVAFFGATTVKSKGWIILFNGTTTDILDLADETTWIDNWAALGGSIANRPSIVATDGVLYFGMGNNNLGSLTENTLDGFAPGTGASYTVKNNSDPALDIKKDFVIRDLVELGNKLLICGAKSGDNNSAIIFPWDKDATTFNIPIILHEDGDAAGWQTISIGLKTYIQVGKRGKWYITNGTEALLFAQMPITLTALIPASTLLNRKAIDIVNGLIYFGMSADSTQKSMGIYSLNPNTGAINFEYLISTNKDGSVDSIEVTSINSLGNKKFISTFSDSASSTFGADKINTTRYTSDLVYLVSRFYRVGGKVDKRTFNTIEIQLSKPLASGDSVKLYYRTAQNGSWLNVQNGAVEDAVGDTFSFISTVGDQSAMINTTIKVENIQFKCALNDEAELLEIIAN